MERKHMRIAAAIAAAVAVVAGLGILSLPSRPQPGLKDLLGMPETQLDYRLYPGVAVDEYGQAVPMDSAIDVLTDDGFGTRIRYITNKDASTEEIFFLADGVHKDRSQSYYALLTGEVGRRPYISRLFGLDAKGAEIIIDEVVLRRSGLIQQHTVLSPDGSKSIVDFAEDGVTHLGEQYFLAKECCSPAKLRLEKRWRADAAHTLSYLNELNAEGLRVITEYDTNEKPIKVATWGAHDTVAGMTIVAFYPGTDKVRLEAKGSFYSNDVTFRRLDGTIERTQMHSSSSLHITYFDATGTVMTLEQWWWRDPTTLKYKPGTMTTFKDGVKVRQWGFYDNKLKSIEDYNLTIDGVFYSEIDSNYDNNGFLERVIHFGQTLKERLKDVKYTPADNIRVPTAPGYILEMAPQTDDIPVPPPQTGPYG